MDNLWSLTAKRRAADAFQVWNRKRKAEVVTRYIDRHALQTVILVGVGGVGRSPVGGLVEDAVAARCTVVATADMAPRQSARFVLCDGRALPFKAAAVDMVFSNAVIEHVGSESDQRCFVAEHARVGRTWMTTTPNRWFPVESHTLTLLRHWWPAWRQRQTLFTRLLGRSEFADLAGPQAVIHGRAWSPTFIAHGRIHLGGDDLTEATGASTTGATGESVD